MIKLGTDAEFFYSQNGVIASAIGIIGGSKEQPRWVQNGNLQEDNVLAEMAIHPAGTLQEFQSSIHALKQELQDVLPEGGGLVTAPWHVYTRDELLSFGSNALRFGCSPELNAWTEEEFVAPSPYTEVRTAAAHVHFSYPDPSVGTSTDIVRTMDYLLGLWSVPLDNEGRRRSMYGRAGSCRIKEYGAEYRVLSNFWIDSDELIQQVWNRTVQCVQFHHILPILMTVVSSDEVQRIINEYDVPGAQRALIEVEAIMEDV